MTMTDTQTERVEAAVTPVSVGARTAMWGRVGEIFDEAPKTASEAMIAARLNWTVSTSPGGAVVDGEFKQHKGDKYVVRDDSGDLLGKVGARYNLIQNEDVFSMCDQIVDDGGAKYESAWSVRDGRVVGLTMRLPQDVEVLGGDPHGSFIIARTTHDGSGALVIAVGLRRMACLNEVAYNLRESKRVFKVRHTEKAAASMVQARNALQLSFKYNEEFAQAMEQMAAKTAGEKRSRRLLTEALKAAKVGALDRDLAGIMHVHDRSASIADDFRGTGYGLYQATTEFYDHVRSYRRPEAQVMSNQFGGQVSKVRQNVAELILASS